MDTTLTIKTPKKLRDEAKKTAGKLGIPLTTVINAMLAQFVRKAIRDVMTGSHTESFDSFEDWREAMRK